MNESDFDEELRSRLSQLAAGVPVRPDDSTAAIPMSRVERSRIGARGPQALPWVVAAVVLLTGALIVGAGSRPTSPRASATPAVTEPVSAVGSAPATSSPSTPSTPISASYSDGLPMTINGEHAVRLSDLLAGPVPTGEFLVAAWDAGPLAVWCPAQISGRSNPPCPSFEGLADARGGPSVVTLAWQEVSIQHGTALVLQVSAEPRSPCVSTPPGACPGLVLDAIDVVWVGDPALVAASSPSPLPTSSKPWWLSTEVTTCGSPAVYRIVDGFVRLGDCAGLLLDPPQVLRIGVGDVVEVHMTLASPGGPPIYPLPISSDQAVLMLESSTSDGTASFRAIGFGTATLTSTGHCLNNVTNTETNGPCPVLLVKVGDKAVVGG